MLSPLFWGLMLMPTNPTRADDVPALFQDDHSTAEWRVEIAVFGPLTSVGRKWLSSPSDLDQAYRLVPEGGIVRQRCVGYTPWQTVASA